MEKRNNHQSQKPKQKTIVVGDLIDVDVVQPTKGKFPIGRYRGIVCKLVLPEYVDYLEYGCTIRAQVNAVKPKLLVVEFERMVRTKQENEDIIASKMDKLKSKQPVHQTKHKVVKKGNWQSKY